MAEGAGGFDAVGAAGGGGEEVFKGAEEVDGEEGEGGGREGG